MALRFLSNQTIDSTLDLTGRVKVSGSNTDQYYFEGQRNGVGVTYRLYDNSNNVYHDSWTSQIFRINQNGGSGGYLGVFGGNVGIGITPASSVALDVKEPDTSNDLILGLTAGTGSRAQIRSVVQTSTESALSFHTTLSSSTQERFRILNTGAFSLGNSGTNYGTAGQVLTSNGNSAPYWSTPTSGTITGSGTANYVTKFTGTTAIGNSSIVDNGSIVTMNQDVHMDNGSASKMLVFRNDAKTRKIQLWSTANNDYEFYGFGIEGSTLVYSVYSTSDDHVFFSGASSTSRNELMRIGGDGDVGINHSSPKSKLSIVGDGGVNGYSGVIGIENTDGDPWACITLTDDIDDTSAASNYYLIGRGVSYASRQMSFHVPTASNYGSGAQPKIIFASTGADTLFSVEASTGTAYHKGSVGIGTTSPTAKLHVAGDTYVSGQLGQGVTIANKLVNYGAEFRSNGASAQIFFGRDGGNVGTGAIGADATYVMKVWKSDFSSPFVIEQTGDVGIGTTSPSEKLEVSGSVKIGNMKLQNANGGRIGFNRNTANGAIYSSSYSAFQINGASSGLDYLSFEAYNSSGTFQSQMVYTNSGNLGIGTASPLGKLDVYRPAGASGTAAIVISNGESNGKNWALSTEVIGGGDFALLQSASTGGTPTPTGTNVRFIINNSGNVGIGTTSPTAKLEIDNGSTAGGSLLKSSSSSYTAHFIANTGSGNAGIYCDASNGDFIGSDYVFFGQHDDKWAQISAGHAASGIRFMPSDTIRMVINNSGNVGIGTTSPSYKLSVNHGASSGGGITTVANFSAGTGSAANDGAQININNWGDNYGGFIRTVNTQGTPNYLNPRMEFGLNYNTYLPADMATKMTILGNGNVGINTTSPSSLLHISGSGTVARLQSSSSYVDMLLVSSGNTGFLNLGATGMNFYVNGGSASNLHMHISNAGRVGVGVLNPSARLQVNFDGDNGSGGLVEYGIAHSSSVNGQATIGSWNTGDGYANLNLASSNGTYFWHLSKRPSGNSHRLEYFFYESGFNSRFIFTKLGDFHADGDIVAYSTTASDEKLKDNIEPIHNALDKVSKLNGVSFTWNCGSRKDEKDLGVIAQNVEKVLPELVREKESPYHDDQTIKTVDYEKLTAVLIEAVKELQQKVEKLEKKKCCCK